MFFLGFVRLYTTDLYNYGVLRIVYFSLSCKAPLSLRKHSISSQLLFLQGQKPTI